MDTRDRLLDAAIRCLASDGWSRTTTRRIVAEAGAHLPDVKYHFGNKDQLMHEAAVHAARRWASGPLGDMAAAVGQHPRAQLTEVLGRFIAGLQADRAEPVAAVETFAQLERSEALRNELAAAYEDFRTEVAGGVRANAGLDAQPLTRNVATVLMALFDGLALQWLIDPDAIPSERELVEAIALIATTLAERAE